MSEQIKQCPYCGTNDCRHAHVGDDNYIVCNKCGSTGPESNNEADAVLLWNAAANQIEKLRQQLDRKNQYLEEALREKMTWYGRAIELLKARDEARAWARKLYNGYPTWRMSGSSYVPQSPEWLEDKAG